MDSAKVVRGLAVLLFSAGILLGVALFGSTTWGDLEASLFNVAMSGEKRLSTLRCPVMITTAETGTVSASFKNSLERATEFRIRTHISDGYVTLMREITSPLPLEPGERGTLEWTVTPDDAVYGRLIMVRVYLFSKYPLPSRQGTCGILVVDWPLLTGTQYYILILAASLLSMGGGIGLWINANRPLSRVELHATYAMATLAGSVLAGIIVSLLRWWVAGVLILTIIVLMIGAIIGYFTNRTSGSGGPAL